MAKFELYKGSDSQYRWRLKSSNGQVIATGGEGYSSKSGARTVSPRSSETLLAQGQTTRPRAGRPATRCPDAGVASGLSQSQGRPIMVALHHPAPR